MQAPVAGLLAAGAVVGLAAWRSSRQRARQGLPPPSRARPLPWIPADRLAQGAPWPAAVAAGAAALAAVAALAGAPEGLAAVGAAWCALVLLAALVRPGRPDAASPGRARGWGTAVALALAAWLASWLDADQAPWAVLGALVAVGSGALTLGPARLARLEPFGTVLDRVGTLAPLARQPGGGWALAHPAPALLRRAPSRLVSVTVGGVGAALLLGDGAVARLGADGPLPRAAVLAAATALAALVGAAALREHLVPALAPAAGGWAAAAHAALLGDALGGAAAPAADVVALAALLAGHLLAVDAAHRAAIPRHDPRGARAVQFPLRLALTVSAGAGAAVIAS